MKFINPKHLARYAVISVLFMWVVLFATQTGRQPISSGVEGVRGKSPAAPLSDVITPEEILAQDLALSDPRVQDLTVGKNSEVFGIKRVGMQFPANSSGCAGLDCRQVEIYLWAENTTVTVIVNVQSREIYDVLVQPGVHPGLSYGLMERAVNIIYNAPEVAETLGFQPQMEEIEPMEGDLLGTSCDGMHVCASATFRVGDRFMWATADLTDNKLAGIGWSPAPENDGTPMDYTPQGCPPAGSVNQDGWSVSYETTPSDGFRVYNVSYNSVLVATDIKLVEWHADYGSSGYRDSTGCGGGGGGGFPIYPYGDTAQYTIYDDQNNPIGFELVQDFRMGGWGGNCNYRYEQHMQFYIDGKFRVSSGAYGRGCGTNAVYRPVERVDIAINGDANDNFDYYDGAQWVPVTTETYRTPYAETGHGPHTETAEGYAWRVYDTSGTGYLIKKDIGMYGEDGTVLDCQLPSLETECPFIYVVQHHANEGDSDLGVIGACCNDNHNQGPDLYLNSESVADQNIVIWHVPQGETDAFAPGYYCWTVTTSEYYPCFMGLTFLPDAPLGTTSGTISLQGRSDYTGAEISAFNGVSTFTTVTDAAGDFSLDLPIGTYDVSVEMDGYLDATISGIEVTEGNTTNLPSIMLPGGDANDSDKINILDLALIGSHYGLNCGDPNWDGRADINADCTVNLLDLTIAASNFQNTSPVIWE